MHRYRCYSWFSGETDALFESTCKLLKNNPIDYFHVFSYSESMAHSRKFENIIDKNTIKLRSLKYERCIMKMVTMKTHINSVLPVLFEQEKMVFGKE